MSIYADYTAIITSNCDLDIARKQAREISTKLYHCCVANELLINIVKTNLVLFHMKNKPVSKYFVCIHTDLMQINRVSSIQYLGFLLDQVDEHLYWHDHVDQICTYPVKYFHIKIT